MRDSDAQSRANNAIAMVATSTDRLPDASRLLAACGATPERPGGLLASIFGRKAPAAKDGKWEDKNLIVPFHGGQLIVSLMPAPIPWSELEGPCATAWWWPDAEQRMREHKYHFLVVFMGGSTEPVERRLALTKLVTAILADTDAVGVYWGEGTLVHEPAAFLRQAQSAAADSIPGTLWIDVRVEENDDGSFRCFTTGMVPLGFLEIEVERSALPPEELMEFIGNTACYIVNGRRRIKPGETMGRTATEQYTVQHGPSMFDRETVMQLVMA